MHLTRSAGRWRKTSKSIDRAKTRKLYGDGGGLNTDKYQSFELYRRHTEAPEIITFDELLAPAEGLLDVSSA
jgi:hypothetical protein